ncbi:MAG: hypothetical protein DRN15_09280 [Thermoprotei archaeon]|nr:MAG: hypothetical protein DRN15_09280 [Thermoprotei archaeon]
MLLSVLHIHQALKFLLKAILIKGGYRPMKRMPFTHSQNTLELKPGELNFLRELAAHHYASRYPGAR